MGQHIYELQPDTIQKSMKVSKNRNFAAHNGPDSAGLLGVAHCILFVSWFDESIHPSPVPPSLYDKEISGWERYRHVCCHLLYYMDRVQQYIRLHPSEGFLD